MPKSLSRDPRAPKLARDLERPEVEADVFVDEALHEALLLEGVRLADVQAKKVELKRCVLADVDLSGAILDGLELVDGSITGSSLANLRSRSGALQRVVIESSRLTGVMLLEPRLIDVIFRDCPMDLSSFRFGRLDRVRFERCRLTEADFQGTTANACTFIDCDLTSAQFSQANFAGSAFRGCRFAGVNGVEALKETQMAWEDVLELATALAASLGIEVREDIS